MSTDQIQALTTAIQSHNVRSVAALINALQPPLRAEVVSPALAQLADSDPASAQWFIRHVMTPDARDQLKQGILAATVDYLQASGFQLGQDFELEAGELILSRAALPYAAPDDDPWGQLLVAEFCQLRD